jgi:hypothetical protein
MLKEENESVSEFNNHFSKLYFKIPQNVRPNDEFTLHCYFKAYDESFGLLLREKDLHNLEEAQVVAIKLERNIITARKGQPSHSRLFDPQGRASQEVKKEATDENSEVPSRFVDLLQELTNKMIRLEKNLQNQ